MRYRISNRFYNDKYKGSEIISYDKIGYYGGQPSMMNARIKGGVMFCLIPLIYLEPIKGRSLINEL